MSDWKREIEFTCDYCGAQPGEMCVTRWGNKAGFHVSRLQQENAAWLRANPDDPRAAAVRARLDVEEWK